MRPRSITMEGFGAFRDRTTVDLTDADLVALTGPTGAGKSTIIDALTFVLYGSVARYDDQRVVAPVINQASSVAKVQLDFDLHGVTYRAVRVVRRTKTGATTPEARLERGDEVLAEQAGPMTARVTELLGLDAGQFNKTVVLPQGRFAEFLHDKPAQRQATMRRLLDLELYERLGRTARARAATARSQADGFGVDATAQAEALSDERRDELDARIQTIAGVAETLTVAGTRLDELTAERSALDARLGEIDAQLARLAAVVPPSGLDEAATERDVAATQAASAAVRLDEARRRQATAVAAVAAGPDLATARMQQAAHRRHRDALERVSAVRAEGEDVRRRSEAAASAWRDVEDRLAALDAEVDTADTARRNAADALEAAGDEVALRGWSSAHERLTIGRRHHDEAVEQLTRLQRAAEAAADAVTAAADAERAARDALRTAERHAGAGVLIAALRPGDPCPVCQQVVHELPDTPPDAGLESARAAAAAADAALHAARGDADEIRGRQAAAAEAVRLRALALAADEQLVAEGPDVETITAALVAIAEARTAVTATTIALDTARRARAEAGSDPATHAARQAATAADRAVVAHEAALVAAEQQLAVVAAELDGGPDAATVDDAVATAIELAERRAAADLAVAEAERADTEARRHRSELDQRLAAGRAELMTARDGVAGLGPPILDQDDVAGAWATLVAWASATAATVTAEGATARARRAEVTTAAEDLVSSVRAAVAEVAPGATGGRDALREAVVRAEVEARSARETFDARRAELASLCERIAGLRETAAVADTLGRLLSVTGFESWLMESALVELSERASVRLRELSGGRFSLVMADREFLVRDHQHADDVRNVRTLSGGETFLASLALALALAEATTELAPEGAPTIESIFLDEGFGTLDPETMDTVAAAIEELGASGRTVVLVTHVRELADRMPVRIEVRPGPDTSTVERVDA